MAGILKIKCQNDIYRLRFDIESFSYDKLLDMFKGVKSSDGMEPHYRDDEGDLCVLNELTFVDFAANAGSQTLQVELHDPEDKARSAQSQQQPRKKDSKSKNNSKKGSNSRSKKHRSRSPSSSSSSSSSSSGSSDSSSDSGSSSSSDSDSGDDDDVPVAVVEAFLQSLADEYVLCRKCAVGKFLKKSKIPRTMMGKVDSTEKKVSRSKDPRATIRDLARKWEVTCPDCCTSAAIAPSKAERTTAAAASAAASSGAPEAALPSNFSREQLELHRTKFVKALVAEYLRGEDGDVGKFFKKYRPSAPWDEQYRNFEDAVRKSDNPADSIQSLANYWQIAVPPECQEGVEPPFNVYTNFLTAIDQQYQEGAEGAVGEFYDRCRDVKAYRTVSTLEQLENKFKEQLEKDGDYEAALEQLKTELGLPVVVELNGPNSDEPAQAPSSCAAAAASSPKSEVSSSCAAAASLASSSQTNKKNKQFDFEFPVAIAPGEWLDLRWNIGDDPMGVALSFVTEHGIPIEEADKIASYVDHITASSAPQ